jgi:8-amino-7-oxononanoate synthase
MDTYLKNILKQHQEADLYRSRKIHDKTFLNFCSNDYLGLANHPSLKATWQQTADKYGIGSGGSHLITGHTQAHHELETTLATYTQRERALLFSTGYMANLGVITSLVGRHDAIFLDKLNHASLIDAALLSRAKIHRYAHNDISNLAHLLAKSSAKHKLIVTDGVFSMDGDIALLADIVELANKYQAWLMVDDAHGLGVIGNNGRGSLEMYNLDAEDVPILMGTLGKAFGVFGAFVAGSELLIETLIQSARSYIYTTALPPALAETIKTSITIAQQESWRRQHLQELINYFRSNAEKLNIELMNSITPIQGIIIGDSKSALAASAALYEQGIIVTAIRPPTVPQGTARLRITFSALHQKEQVDQLLAALVNVI